MPGLLVSKQGFPLPLNSAPARLLERSFAAVLHSRCPGTAACCCALALLATPSPSLAQDFADLSAEVSFGAQYDSYVSIEASDITARRGDEALLVGASVGAEKQISSSLVATAGYDFSQTLHDQVSDFDLQTHSLSGGLEFDRKRLGVDVAYRFNHVLLDQKPYLDIHAVTPAVSYRPWDRLLFRTSYTYLRKHFVTTERLDGETQYVTIDAWRAIAGRKGYVSIGGRYEKDNVTFAPRDYRGWQANGRIQYPFLFLNPEARGRISLSYSERDYAEADPAIGEIRREARSSISAILDTPFIDPLDLRATLRLTDRDSNVPAYDYREVLASILFSWEF